MSLISPLDAWQEATFSEEAGFCGWAFYRQLSLGFAVDPRTSVIDVWAADGTFEGELPVDSSAEAYLAELDRLIDERNATVGATAGEVQ